MLEHDRFEELASLSAIRELSPEEHKEFERHKNDCPQCREAVAETNSMAAGLFLAGLPQDENGDSDVELHRRLRKAISRQLPQAVSRSVVKRYRKLIAAGAAAAFLLGGGIGVTLGYRARPASAGKAPVEVEVAADTHPPVIVPKEEARPQFADLQNKMEEERRDVRTLQEKLAVSDRHAVELKTGLDEARKQATEQAQELTQARNELAETRDRLAAARESASASEARIVSLEYKLTDREARLEEATASVEREREMLSAGREVRDIMGARDLHIVDVIDRDGQGRPRKAFGRAFYTQGRSLIFYAFDLPTKGTADGRFVYAAWGSNSNNLNGKAARSLGIFYNDDQTQHRWAMKFDDPKVLEEIDTVFVTLEPAGKPFSMPTGKALLEAYFGTPPNHP